MSHKTKRLLFSSHLSSCIPRCFKYNSVPWFLPNSIAQSLPSCFRSRPTFFLRVCLGSCLIYLLLYLSSPFSIFLAPTHFLLPLCKTFYLTSGLFIFLPHFKFNFLQNCQPFSPRSMYSLPSDSLFTRLPASHTLHGYLPHFLYMGTCLTSCALLPASLPVHGYLSHFLCVATCLTFCTWLPASLTVLCIATCLTSCTQLLVSLPVHGYLRFTD